MNIITFYILFLTIIIKNILCGSFLPEKSLDEIVVTPETIIQGGLRMFKCGISKEHCQMVSNFTISPNNGFDRCVDSLEIYIPNYQKPNHLDEIEREKQNYEQYYLTIFGTLEFQRERAKECSELRRY